MSMEKALPEDRLMWWLFLAASTCAGWFAAMLALPWLSLSRPTSMGDDAYTASVLALLCAAAVAGAAVAYAARAACRRLLSASAMTTSRRRWLRFSLRTLFVGFALLALIAFGGSEHSRRKQLEAEIHQLRLQVLALEYEVRMHRSIPLVPEEPLAIPPSRAAGPVPPEVDMGMMVPDLKPRIHRRRKD
jgi:hypothetical protein